MSARGAASLVSVSLALLVGACGDDDRGRDRDGGHEEGIGNSCREDADCETNNCYLGPGGGYCTTTCSNEGSESECPRDTVCKPIQGGARRCLLVCGSESACRDRDDCRDDWCPSGSSCVNVSNTDLRACEPDPG